MSEAESYPDAKSHTLNHRDCPACAARSLRGVCPISPTTTFAKAFGLWLETRSSIGLKSNGKVKRLSIRTIETYQEYADAVGVMLGDVLLGEIHDGHLLEYEERRATCDGEWTRECGQNRIRKETDMVRRILKYAKLWTSDLEEAYEPLPMLETDDQRRLSDEQIQKLIAILGQKTTESQWVLYDSVIALHTCSSTNERRLAQIKDVMLAQKIFRVGPAQAKNKYRNRRIPLETKEVLYAFDWLLRRAKNMGADKPEHYLFPWRDRRGQYDPTKPMTRFCLIQQFEGLGAQIGDDRLTPYALRHTAMSILAEAGIPIDIILAYGGQVSERMRKHYTTVSMLAKRKAQVPAWAHLPLLNIPDKKPPTRSLEWSQPHQYYFLDILRKSA